MSRERLLSTFNIPGECVTAPPFLTEMDFRGLADFQHIFHETMVGKNQMEQRQSYVVGKRDRETEFGVCAS